MSKLSKQNIILISSIAGILGLVIIACSIFIPIYYVYWKKSKSATETTVVEPKSALAQAPPQKKIKKTHPDLMSRFSSYNYNYI